METEKQTSIPSENVKLTIGQQALEVAQLIGEIILLLLKTIFYVGEAIYREFFPIEKSVKGEIVLVTGAGHGIGKELALKYASLGATVVAWDVNEKNNEETVKEISRCNYPRAKGYICDVTDREQVLKTAQKVQSEIGDVTILINNAGIMPCHNFLNHKPDQIRKVMDVNVFAHFWTLEAFLPSMMKNNYGHIVELSSCAGLFGLRNLAPYCASKFAVRGLAEGLEEDLRNDPSTDKIKITIVCPYMVATGMCKKPRIRFSNFMPLLKPVDVAAAIVTAQRRNVFELTIPNFLLKLNYFARLFPFKVALLLADFMDTFVESD